MERIDARPEEAYESHQLDKPPRCLNGSDDSSLLRRRNGRVETDCAQRRPEFASVGMLEVQILDHAAGRSALRRMRRVARPLNKERNRINLA